jgi:hypothetical protein
MEMDGENPTFSCFSRIFASFLTVWWVFVWFFLVYSPDLNPLLLLWSKLKAFLRKLKTRSLRGLQVALGVALGDICGWFKHDGYESI